MQYKKNLYKILFLVILLGFIISLAGCNWLSFGLLNIIDPQAQIRVDYRLDNLTAQGTAGIWFTIFSLNEAEFIGEQFSFEYYVDGVKIPELTRTIGATFYVPPSPLSSFENPVRVPKIEPEVFPVSFQDVIDYMNLHPTIVELDATITVMGTDGAGHSISKTIAFDLPALLPGIDFVPPTAVITVTPGTTGTEPFTVIFDGSKSCDKRNEDSECKNSGIASYAWDFGDGTTGTGVMPAAHTYTNGEYIVKLTVTDYFGNVGVALETILVGEAGAPTAVINVTPSTTGILPFTVYFDASGSSVVSDCGACSIVSYAWNFGDGTAAGTGMTISHIFTAAGTYTVVLTVTDSNGNTAYDSVTITVNASGAPSSITIQAIPSLVTSATGSSAITVTVKDANGNPVPNLTPVAFLTTFGTLSSSAETTVNGIVTTVLTFSAEGSATVTAISGSITNFVVVTCAVP